MITQIDKRPLLEGEIEIATVGYSTTLCMDENLVTTKMWCF